MTAMSAWLRFFTASAGNQGWTVTAEEVMTAEYVAELLLMREYYAGANE